MLRFIFPAMLLLLFVNSSCEKCTQCSYTYTETIIKQTPNGEEEEIVTHTGYVYNDDGTVFAEECIKGDETSTIEAAYQNEQAETSLSNFDYSCVEN